MYVAFSGPIIAHNDAKPNQSRITFDTHLKISLVRLILKHNTLTWTNEIPKIAEYIKRFKLMNFFKL